MPMLMVTITTRKGPVGFITTSRPIDVPQSKMNAFTQVAEEQQAVLLEEELASGSRAFTQSVRITSHPNGRRVWERMGMIAIVHDTGERIIIYE